MDTPRGIPPELATDLRQALAEVGVVGISTESVILSRQSRCVILRSDQDGRRLVLKVFNSEYRHNSVSGVQTEFDALRLFSDATRGCGSIGVAEPLYLFQDPPAYLMTHVDGVDVGTYLRRNRPSADKMGLLAERIIKGVRIFHTSTASMYGDFQPDNVLVDRSLRTSFIDPTTPNPAYVELERRVDWYPMSADLGYWAYSASARGFRQSLTSPLGALLMLRLTTLLVDTAARQNGEANRNEFVNSVFQAARFHVDRLSLQASARSTVLAVLTEALLRLLSARSRRAGARG